MADLAVLSLEIDVTGVNRGASQAQTAFKNLEQQITTSSSKFDQLSKTFDQSATHANTAAQGIIKVTTAVTDASNKVQQSHGIFSTFFEKLRSGFSGLGGIIGTAFSFFGGQLLTQGFNALTGGMQGLVKSGIEFSDALVKAGIAFRGMLGGQAQAQSMIHDLEQFAEKTPFHFQELIELSTQLLAVGFDAEQTKGLLRDLSDTVTGLGRGTETLHELVHAFSQLQAGGRVTGIQLRELERAAVPVMEIIAAKTGLTADAFRRMVEQGKVGSEGFINVIREGMQEKFGGLTEAFAESTVEGIASNTQDILDRRMAEAGKSSIDGLKDMLRGLNQLMSSDAGTKFAEGVSKGLELAIKPVQAFINTLGETGDFTKAGAAAFKAFTAEWTTQIKPFLSNLWDQTIKPWATELATNLANLILKPFGSDVQTMMGKIGGLGDKLSEAAGKFTTAMDSVKTSLDALINKLTGGKSAKDLLGLTPESETTPEQKKEFQKKMDAYGAPYSPDSPESLIAPKPKQQAFPGVGLMIVPSTDLLYQKPSGPIKQSDIDKFRQEQEKRQQENLVPKKGEPSAGGDQLEKLLELDRQNWSQQLKDGARVADNTDVIKGSAESIKEGVNKLPGAEPGPPGAKEPRGLKGLDSLIHEDLLKPVQLNVQTATDSLIDATTTIGTSAALYDKIVKENLEKVRKITVDDAATQTAKRRSFRPPADPMEWENYLREQVPKVLETGFHDILTGAKNFRDGLAEIFTGAWDAIAQKLSQKVAQSLTDNLIEPIFNSLFGAIKGLFNGIAGNLGGKGGFFGFLGQAAGFLGTFFLAEGGPAQTGMPYIVGERGPELFIPSTPGYVVPNGQIGAGSRHGESAFTQVNVSVPQPSVSSRKSREQVLAATRREMEFKS